MTVKNPKETFTPTPAVDAPVEAKPLQTQVQDSFAAKPQETNNIVIGNEAGKPSNIVKITNSDGKLVDAVQTMGTDGKPVLIYENETYKLDESKSKAGNQSWVSDDGGTVTQTRGRSNDSTSGSTSGSTTDATSGTGSTTDSTSAKPTSGSSAGGDSATATPGGGSVGGEKGTATPGGDLKAQPIDIDVDKKKDSDIKFQPIDVDKSKGGEGGGEGGGHKGGGEGGNEGGGRKGGGEGGGNEGGERKGGGEGGGNEGGGRKDGGEGGGNEGGGRKGGGEGGGAEKGAERGEGKLSIPEKSVEKPTEKSPDKPADKPAEKPESGSEKPLEKIDLSKPEARRELFEALKSMRDILDGKTDLKKLDPNQRALVEQLMKLDQQTTNKLFNLLSLEFQGKGTGMSDAAYMFNLRTLMGLEKLTSPTQPAPPIPGLSPELAKSLFNLFRMYSSDAQTAQRSTMLAEAYKFSVDYNAKLGLNDKNGLTSRDVLVALNSMSKDFGDLATKQSGSLANLMAAKETHAQLVGKDVKDQTSLTAEQAKLREMTGATLDQHAAAQARAQEGVLKAPQGLQTPQDTAVGKVEGQILKDARFDAHAAQQHAAEAATTKSQASQFGQKDPLTAEQKELGERDQGVKRRLEEERDRDKEKDEIARRMAMEAAIAAAGGARATSADITEGKEDGDKDEKKQDEKEARRQYRTKQGDTLEMIAETQLKRKTAATLIYNINKDRIPAKVMGNLHIISMKQDMVLELPTPNEAKIFKGPYLQFQYREFGSAEEELAFWQKFISGQEPGHSSLFDKFGLGQGGSSPAGAGVDDSFAAEAFTAAQRQSIRNQLGIDKESTSQTTKTVRYGESIRKFAARTLFDEALWELIARKNNLPVIEDNKGEKTVRLKSYQKLIMPTAAEIKEYKQAAGSTTQQFEMVSRECPKCHRLVRQNESVCPPPCFYAFVETGSADVQPVEPVAEVKDDPTRRMLRRRRTTGFVPQSESKPDEVVDKPFENEVIDTVLKAAGLSSAAKVEVPQLTSKMPIPASSGMASNPSKRGIKVHEFDSLCRVVLTPKDREGNKFERRLEVRKDDAWIPCVVYEIGQQESYVTEFDPSGAPRKQRIDLPFEPAMELSENHINEAWKEYKQQFLGG